MLAALKAAGESTRLRLLHVLLQGEFNVSELVRIMEQSQPRLSRHLRLLSEAGLVERQREGSWVIFRLRQDGVGGALATILAAMLDEGDAVLARDRARARQALDARRARAMEYFASVAAEWDRIRSLHVAEDAVEAAMREMAGQGPFSLHVDIGTGTGRMLELFAPVSREAVGADSSREMLNVARARLEKAGLQHARVRLAEAEDLPLADEAADFVTIHQVLHYLSDPERVIAEAARVLKPRGRLLVADFAPHELEFLRDECAHLRLGISEADMARWLRRAGLTLRARRSLQPPAELGEKGLTVSLWLAERTE